MGTRGWTDDAPLVHLMEPLVLSLALVLSLIATVACARASRQAGGSGRLAQIGVGLLVGAAAALMAAMPYADVVPDPWEPYLVATFTFATVAIGAVWVVAQFRRRRHVRPMAHARDRLSGDQRLRSSRARSNP